MYYTIRALFFLGCLVSFVLAGTTGKIAGIVDDSETSEPLPGVNVFLKGTSLGAATDLDGYYAILNVPPDTYTLVFSYMGYADYEVKNVKVQIDLTTTINAQLKPDVLISETVVVEAERPVIARDVSNSQLNIEAETIESMPIQTVSEALTLQAGIEEGTRGVVIRGGEAYQTVFMIDGLSHNDERSNYPYTAVSLSSVEEIQVQTGGFNAEYGQARSGIVNVVTKEGNISKYTGILTYRYSPAAPKHFGGSLYDPYSYFNRPYFDPAVMWTGTDNGNWDEYTQRQYPFFEGWVAVSEATLLDENPDNDLTPEAAKRLYQWYKRRQGDIKKSDYIADAGFGGPVPFISNNFGNLRFHLSHYNERDMFVFPLSKDAYRENHTQLKLTSNISSSLKLVINALYGEVSSVSPYNWTTTPNGRVLRSTDEVADLTNSSNTGMSIPYMPGYFSPSTIYRNIYDLKLTHTLSSKTLYEFKFQYKRSKHNTFQTSLRDTTKRYEIVPGLFVDEAPYGYWGYGVTGPAGIHLGGWMNLGRDKSLNTTYTMRLDFSSQFNRNNQIKTGMEIVLNNYDINSSSYSPSMSTWTRSMIYDVSPYRFSIYAQDKMEFEGFIANVGIRGDYSDANTKKYQLDSFDEFYSAGYGDLIEEEAPTSKAGARFTLSPRLGISHPVGENSKLYFNYGHFRAEPFSSYRFRIQRESNGQVTYMGDPALEPEKTVAYELGFEQNVLDMFLFKIAGYYKDISDQTGWVLYDGLGNVSYYKAVNNNYEDIRGLEITLSKRTGKWFTGFINYTYDVRTSGYFGLLENHEDPNRQREYLRLNPYQSKPNPQPYARANIDLHTPDDYGPAWNNFHPFGAWRFNILAHWRSGRYYTYNPNQIPGLLNNTQWRDWHNLDVRISKVIKTDLANVQFYLDISNVFNHKYMSMAGFSDNYDWLAYMESLNFSWEKGVQNGDDRIGDYRKPGVAYEPLEPNPDDDPEIKARNERRKEKNTYIDMPNIKSLSFLNPRDFIFGISINF